VRPNQPAPVNIILSAANKHFGPNKLLMNPESSRAFLIDLLEHWREAIGKQSGLFYPDFDREWAPVDSGSPVSLVSQCRLIYTMSVGCELTSDDRFQAIAKDGIRGLEQFFRVGDTAHYCWSVNRDGSPSVTVPNAYGYAFVILAQASAARVFDNAAWAESALTTYQFMRSTLGDEHGGLKWLRPIHSPDIPPEAKSQNPMMHTFEALMALANCPAATGEVKQSALSACRDVLKFMTALSGFTDGMLIEWYDSNWIPLSIESGGVIDLGHAFEWAFLLSEWHELTGDMAALAGGQKFLEVAMSIGIDSHGGILSTARPDGAVISRTNGLWQQCEAIRALHRYATRHHDARADELLRTTLSFYEKHFLDTEYGGVYAGPVTDGKLISDYKGDAWKLDYHSTNMLLELIK
jgi:mannose/cellobiose epimerase-like protein (N-acyl-D-glucosamine 2-epimerase family)